MPRRNVKRVVGVEGLEEFIRDLGLAPAQMKQADRLFRNYAAARVLEMARAKAAHEGGVANKAKSDLKITGLGRIRYGGSPYDMGAEFGSYAYKQFERWRGNDENAGYFLWPAVREYRDKAMADDWIDQVWSTVQALSEEGKR